MSGPALRNVQHHIAQQSKYARLNVFITLTDAAKLQASVPAAEDASKPLHGRLIAIKDNIATADLPTTAASKILSNYTSPYPSTVATLLTSAGALVAGKTNLDELGMGSHSRAPFAGPVLSPYSRNGEALSPGGSSGGSAVAVATGQCWAALGTDTGGSVRLPAAYTGTVGFKPSYGRVSRWGVLDYANSLDTVGTLTSTVGDAKGLYKVLDQYDERDPTSLPGAVRERIKKAVTARDEKRKDRPLRVGVPLEYNIASLSSVVKGVWTSLLERVQAAGHEIVPVSLPSTRLALSAYYVLAPAEASSNLAKYDGVRYGTRVSGPDALPKEDLVLFAKTRGEGFGPEVRRRILLGAYTLSSEAIDNYFIQAQKVRRLVQRDFDNVFGLAHPLLDEGQAAGEESVDLLIAPTAPTLPPTVKEVEKLTPVESYMNDVFTVPASLAGLPAVSVPVKLADTAGKVQDADEVEGEVTTTGMQVIAQFGDDDLVLEVAELIEKMQQGTYNM